MVATVPASKQITATRANPSPVAMGTGMLRPDPSPGPPVGGVGFRVTGPRGVGNGGEAPRSRARSGDELIDAPPRSASGSGRPSEAGSAPVDEGRSAGAGPPAPSSSSSHQLPGVEPPSGASSPAGVAWRSSNSQGRRSSTGVSSNAPI